MATNSTTQGTCARCGSRTTRSRLCRDCGRDEAREADLRADESSTEASLYECSECGEQFHAGGLDPCPDCGSYRHVRVQE
jgi:ribosomal protein L32